MNAIQPGTFIRAFGPRTRMIGDVPTRCMESMAGYICCRADGRPARDRTGHYWVRDGESHFMVHESEIERDERGEA